MVRMSPSQPSPDRRAAYICVHAASGDVPILLAIRDKPIDRVDSGWQFVCNSGVTETDDCVLIWAVYEVIELEPTLVEFVSMDVGTALVRCSADSKWQVLGRPAR